MVLTAQGLQELGIYGDTVNFFLPFAKRPDNLLRLGEEAFPIHRFPYQMCHYLIRLSSFCRCSVIRSWGVVWLYTL